MTSFSLQELIQDQERIRITQHNAWILEQKDLERRMELEAKAQEEVRERQLIEQETYSSQANGVPTATVTDKIAAEEAAERVPFEASNSGADGSTMQHRKVDMEVWEASRRRLEEQDRRTQEQNQVNDLEQEQHRHMNLQQSVADRSAPSASYTERERARLMMHESPMSAFDVSFNDKDDTTTGQTHQQQARRAERIQREAPIRQRSGLNPTFGRQVGPGEDWQPQEWQPQPSRRRS